MAQIVDRPNSAGTKAFLVGVHVGADTVAEGRSLLEELGELVWTLGLPVVGSMLVKVTGYQAAYFTGTGRFMSSNKTLPNCWGELMLKVLFAMP